MRGGQRSHCYHPLVATDATVEVTIATANIGI